MSSTPEFGETWVYESIVMALPGIEISTPVAITIQIGLFECGVLLSAWYYDLWSAVGAGTVAVLVAAVGSVEMLRISTLVRGNQMPEPYRRLLFGSSIEVVLGVLTFVAVLTHLFVFDQAKLLHELLGPNPPVLVVYLLLLILWDVSYRIGTGWWTSVTALWRTLYYRGTFEADTARALRRADIENISFGVLQLVLLPFLPNHTVLATALVAHVCAVSVVTGLSVVLLSKQIADAGPPTAI
ncbi:DUF7530 family protein [Halocatena halophila]|uniref:DUF7530 family protein n=1 Tax=Halocatena halophila TaxID=2814576 RepID=UPI002ED5373C